jgi:DNA invertase Pin-like site-specific DNA recombinase
VTEKKVSENGACAVIYCRVSSEEQISNTSLENQERECRAYCQRNGLEVAKVFVEQGESAKTIDRRPALLGLIEYCREHKDMIRAVVVWKIDRLSRHTFHYLKIKEEELAQCQIHSVTEPFQDDASGELLETMLAGFARFDNRVRGDRTRAGMKARLQAGEWTHDVPLGYTRNSGGIQICPDTGPLVRKIFELYGSGTYSQAEILRKITDLGLRTKKGNKLTPQSLNNIVRNRFYAGWIVSKVLGPEPVRGNFEPLVEQELFDRVQAIRLGKQPKMVPRQRSNPEFPLRAFVHCGGCGKPLTGGWPLKGNRNYAYYWCYCKDCRSVSVRKDKLEELFCQHLDMLRPDREHLSLFSHIICEVVEEKRSGYQDEFEAAKRLLNKLEQKKERLVDHLLNGTLDAETYKWQAEKIEAEIVTARLRCTETKMDEYDVEGLLGFAEHVVLNASSLWREADYQKKQILQRTLFPQNISYLDNQFLKAETCLFFKDLQAGHARISSLG